MAELMLSFLTSPPVFYKIDIWSTHGQYMLSPNKRLIYMPKPMTGEFNIYGHRGKAFPYMKNKKKRIIFMGDSVVEGLHVSVEKRFTEILSGKFASKYEIINLGVCGYSFLQEFEYFKEIGLKFNPDYVFWCITYNDLVLHSGEIEELNRMMSKYTKNNFYAKYYGVRGKLENILLSLNFYKYIKYIFSYHSDIDFKKSVYYEINKEEADNLIKQLKILAKNYNFRQAFIFLPANTNIFADKIAMLERVAENNDLQILDFKNYFINRDNKKLFLNDGSDPCHYSVNGNEIVANSIYVNSEKLGL